MKMGNCIICGSSSSSKVSALKSLGYDVCCNYSCVAAFMKREGTEMPVCVHCSKFDRSRKICPLVEQNRDLRGIGTVDLQFKQFGLFCLEFKPKGSSEQTRLDAHSPE